MEAKHVPVLLSAISEKSNDLLRHLLAPEALEENLFKDLVEALNTQLVTAEQFKFHQQSQAPGETVAEFIAELCQLAEPCEFGA